MSLSSIVHRFQTNTRSAAVLRAGLFVVLLAPAVAIGALGIAETYRYETEAAVATRIARADLEARVIEDRIRNMVDISRSVAIRPSLRARVEEGKWDEAIGLLSTVRDAFPDFDRVALVDPAGILRADDTPAHEFVGTSFAYRDWYKGVSANWTTYVSGVFARASDPDTNVIAITSPIVGSEGTPVGILVLQIKPETILGWMTELETDSDEVVFVTDQYGSVVVESGLVDGDKDLTRLRTYGPVQDLLGGNEGEGILTGPLDGVERLAAWYTVDPIGWGITVADRTSDVFAERNTRLVQSGGLFALVVLLDALFGFGVLWVLRANAQREVLEDRLRHEATFRAVFDNARDGIVVADRATGRFIDANPSICAALGYSRAELLARSIADVHPKEARAESRAHLERIVRGDTRPIKGLAMMRKNGSVYFADISASLVTLDGRPCIMGIFHDVTKELQIDRAKSEFVSLSSHQLRTPLTTIGWYVEMLVDGKAGPLTKTQAKYLAEVQRGTRRMVELIGAFLDVSRLELGTFVFERKESNVRECAQAVLDDLRPLIKGKALRLKETYAARLPAVALDPKLLRVVLQNVLTNAVKYTPGKGRIDLSASVDRAGKRVVITVADTGCGIPKHQQDKIFTKLFRADNVRQMDVDGTGLGLYIAKSILDQSGGKIWFDSEENKGTTFYVAVPVR